MRILTACFESGEEFLASYWEPAHEGDPPEIHVHTRTDLDARESVVLDVRLPGLPNRELLRGRVSRRTEFGVWVAVDVGERDTLAFLAAHAAAPGPRPEMVSRNYERYPLALPCEIEVTGEGERRSAVTVDLSGGGAFVTSFEPPAVGSLVLLTLPGQVRALSISGRVVWRRQGRRGGGIGVTFAPGDDARVLREMLRHLSERGRIALS
jgi:Tfp pilus assembly protein PilZ